MGAKRNFFDILRLTRFSMTSEKLHKASETKLVCAVGSRNGTEITKLLVLDFGENLDNKRISYVAFNALDN